METWYTQFEGNNIQLLVAYIEGLHGKMLNKWEISHTFYKKISFCENSTKKQQFSEKCKIF
jgi:hypothetical protein